MTEVETRVWENSLKHNESLLWTGKPKEKGLVDPANRIATYATFGFAVLWLCLSFVYVIPRASNVGSIIISELPAVLAAMIPFLNARSVKNTVYAITDRRVIIKNGNDDYSMEYDKNTRVQKRANGSICIGDAVDIKPSQERHTLLFHGIQDNDKNCTGVVLYTTDDADQAVRILQS